MLESAIMEINLNDHGRTLSIIVFLAVVLFQDLLDLHLGLLLQRVRQPSPTISIGSGSKAQLGENDWSFEELNQGFGNMSLNLGKNGWEGLTEGYITGDGSRREWAT
ncbi:hypothetical protein Tco_0459303 [Tanacetum coccineum]